MEAYFVWALIFAVLLAACGAINELRYRIERWFVWRRISNERKRNRLG
jgi:hypothetical protein